MNLIWFLTIGTFFSLIFGEFGRFPFGGGGFSVTIYDLFLSLTVAFLLIWQVGINKDLSNLKTLKIFLPFWIAALFSLIFSSNLGGWMYLLRFVFYCFFLWIGYSLVRSRIVSTVSTSILVIILGMSLSLLGFVQIIVFPDMTALSVFGFDPHQGRLVSTILDPNLLGSLLNVCLAVVVMEYFSSKKRMYIFFGSIFVAAIILTFSRSAYLFLGVQLLVWGVFIFRKLLLVSAILAGLVFAVVPRFAERIVGGIKVDKSSSERLVSWKTGWMVFKDKPITGVGFNNLRDYLQKNALSKTYSEDGGHAGAGIDSSLLFVLATSGIAGILAYLYLWFGILRKLPKRQKTIVWAVVLGLLVNSQFINSLFFPPLILTLFFWLGSLRAQFS